VTQWSAEELFWIVKNGLKYTGMPAWPAQQRDDEVWAVVAALLRLPQLGAAEYRRMARGELARDPARVEADAETLALAGPIGEDLIACARCHGLRGDGGGAGAFPRLAGLDEAYLYDSLRSYAAGSRPSGIMQPIAVELADDEMRELARHFAALPADDGTARDEAAADLETRRRGGAIAHEGIAAAGVPACAPCHGPVATARHRLYPHLPGQHAPYLIQQLRLWRSGTLATTAQGAVMHAAARGLSDGEIEAVSRYYQHAAGAANDAPPAARGGRR
jgi:cytochrome c553